ncbi:protein SODIUM POTASSIUM ROOT DEFECTIVE 1 [Brachypodium distachyon]|uniref:HMA domain-containing protein n=1 Tax=Brachypodium distachyon TaxID=15368 RepID=I1HP32_BRADI|nr:protein SODIUM POTASSIUM ROOT DEFECTIVE 1 [Brachypodium distachyon]KQK08565.1 hypothetical protein BRADI_2g42550v3 [Brachypodium distachyon]|eukprot:XP_003569297.1 protein SODIUM POTASSIUM ROOT DEFECTIVE 1 [Brachypodium distachyon]
MSLKKALRWLPRGSSGREEDEECHERNGLLRSHRVQNQIVPVTDLDDQPPKAASAAERKTVALNVSMHCHGCARKVEKQISKLEGVVSVKIELGIKRVTVVGDVTPAEVLESVSKVIKYAHILVAP